MQNRVAWICSPGAFTKIGVLLYCKQTISLKEGRDSEIMDHVGFTPDQVQYALDRERAMEGTAFLK